MRPFLLLVAAAVCLSQPLLAGDATVLRYLEFRDGTILRLAVVDEDCQVTLLQADGRLEATTVRLSALQRLTLTKSEDFEQKRALLTTVQRLGSDNFREREQARAALLKFGPAIRPELETCLALSRDPEIQSRLRSILAKLPAAPPPAVAHAPFDQLERKDTALGYVGGNGVAVRVGAKTYHVSRRDLAALSVAAPDAVATAIGPLPAGAVQFRRLGPNDFPPGCTEEPFEKTPDGRALRIGENIEKLFIPKGFVLSTSIVTSFVSVNNYVVEGKSRGLSAATHQPLWEGEITIRFVQPGRENVPAGVTHFGCWIAAVLPKGTALVAYDLHGRELGTIHTERGPNDFLGVRSSVPIHRIKIVPNPAIDKDYTLDDFIFTSPRSADYPHAERFKVQLAGGDRVVCADVSFSREGLLLHGLPGGLPDRACKPAELVRIIAPSKGRPDSDPPPGVYVELRDGSIVYGAEPAGKGGTPVFARRPQALRERDAIVGVWASTYPRVVEAPRTGQILLWDPGMKRWREVGEVKLKEETLTWKETDGRDGEAAYAKLPPLWLAAPAAPAPGTWHIRTTLGEDIVLGNSETFAGRLSKEFTAVWQGQPLRVAAAEVAVVYQVQKAP
jgi:hypothetical protein